MITDENRNYNGRPKGATNKVNTELRKTIKQFIENNQDELASRMSRLSDSEWVKHYTALLKYAIPTLKSTSMSFENSDDGVDFKQLIKNLRFED